jgi:hypothetical protein
VGFYLEAQALAPGPFLEVQTRTPESFFIFCLLNWIFFPNLILNNWPFFSFISFFLFLDSFQFDPSQLDLY